MTFAPGGAPAPPDPRDRWFIGPPCGLRIRGDQKITDYLKTSYYEKWVFSDDFFCIALGRERSRGRMKVTLMRQKNYSLKNYPFSEGGYLVAQGRARNAGARTSPPNTPLAMVADPTWL